MTVLTLLGKPVQIVQPKPRMQCSDEFTRLQDPDLVEHTNAWMADFFGYVEIVPFGTVYSLKGGLLVMNQRTYDKIKRELIEKGLI